MNVVDEFYAVKAVDGGYLFFIGAEPAFYPIPKKSGIADSEEKAEKLIKKANNWTNKLIGMKMDRLDEYEREKEAHPARVYARWHLDRVERLKREIEDLKNQPPKVYNLQIVKVTIETV